MKQESRLRVSDIKPGRTASVSRSSRMPLPSQDIDNYFPKERRYRSAAIGEIKLDRSILRLSTPEIEDVVPKSAKLPSKLEIHPNLQVIEFFKVANTPLKKKLNFKYCVMRSLNDFKELSLPSDRIMEIDSIIPKTSYSTNNSQRFIKSCKFGEIEDVERLIAKEPNLVHAFDNLNMTGLHWSALRNYSNQVDLLISNHSLINPLDCNHRTPLFLASRKGCFESIKVLLLHHADPNIYSNSKKSPLKVSKTKKIAEFLKGYILKFNYCRTIASSLREEYWSKHITPYLKSFK